MTSDLLSVQVCEEPQVKGIKLFQVIHLDTVGYVCFLHHTSVMTQVVLVHVVLLQVVLALLFPAVTCLSVRFPEVSVGSVFHGEFPPFTITTEAEAQHECCGLKAFYYHLHVST